MSDAGQPETLKAALQLAADGRKRVLPVWPSMPAVGPNLPIAKNWLTIDAVPLALLSRTGFLEDS